MAARSRSYSAPVFSISPSCLDALRRALSTWYAVSKRDLPWRRTRDPYAIWISEVMLQQTQISTAQPYYLNFMHRFPDVAALAAADLDTVLKLWEGLGYYSRARNLHRAAVIISAELQGCFPADWKTLRSLPGIGDYTAAAVLSIAFDQPFAVVDGNVKRVLARLFTLDVPINQAGAHKHIQAIADILLDRDHPAEFNQALMEIGALVCTPKRPACGNCPLSHHCKARLNGVVQRYPLMKLRPAVPEQRRVAAAIFKKGRLLLVRRPLEGLLGGYWEFPNIALNSDESPENACLRAAVEAAGLQVALRRPAGSVRHAYTHFKLRMDVYICDWQAGEIEPRDPGKARWVPPGDFPNLPLHKAARKALDHVLAADAEKPGRP